MIETKFLTNPEISTLLIDENRHEDFLKKMNNLLSDFEKNDSKVRRIKNRFSQIIKSATLQTRAKKLHFILESHYKILSISKIDLSFKVDKEKVGESIKQRNSLFHGKNTDNTDRSKFIRSTNELLEICLEILRTESSYITDTNDR